MGDILHSLPAAASMKHSFPNAPLTWVVESTWAPLLQQNSFVDRVICLDRKKPKTWLRTLLELREQRFFMAMDLQGLLKSALTASLARPERIVGWDCASARERIASWFYSNPVASASTHVVDRNLDVAAAAGAANLVRSFPLPAGFPEGVLPGGPFVLASPFAGWKSKQWPLEYYAETASLLKVPLVLNGPPSERAALERVPGVWVHLSGISGLIDATRRAAAIIGVDSGPMHIAAALGKPGVAIFGPTDPERNGPYGGTLQVLRGRPRRDRDLTFKDAAAIASPRGDYERGDTIDPSMLDIPPSHVARIIHSLV